MSAQKYRVVIHKNEAQVQFYEERLDEQVSLEMAIIPGGTFTMGSSPNELEHKDMDGPQHEVQVSSFSFGVYPITQAQWSIVTRWPKVSRKLDPEPSCFKGKNRPVERISWLDTVEFCARLSYKTERRYRLPTEAEWEYACRAGTNTPFHFGETITTDLANYRGTHRNRKGKVLRGNYGHGPKGEFRDETTSIQFFDLANAYGLCDMHGNIFEWCEDRWHSSYKGAPTNGSAWLDGGNSNARVMRGGSYASRPGNCRSAYRIHSSPGNKDSTIGFRVACGAPRAN